MATVEDWGGSFYSPPGSTGHRRSTIDHSEGTWWPAGKHVVPRGRLKQLLARSAGYNARQAIRLFVSDDNDELLTAAACAGTAVELLTKGYLASVDPALLAERGERDAVLILGGHSSAADLTPLEVKSVGAAEALAIAKHLRKELPWQQKDQTVLRVRNAALHMGLVQKTELRRAIVQMCRLITVLLNALELESAAFWGDGAAEVVRDLLDEAKSETARTVAAKTATARTYLSMMLQPLDASTRVVLLTTLSGRRGTMSDHDEQQQCPVCEQQGWLLCGVERGPLTFEDDGDGDYSVWIERTAVPYGFECLVCRLELEDDELLEFDFPGEVELEPDADPYEAYEPDEDMYRGR